MIRWAICVTAAIGAVAVGGGAACEKCFDPPTDPWIRHTLTLTRIMFQPGTEPWDELVEEGAEELVLVLQVSYLGACPNLSRTFVQYLPGLDVERHARGFTVPIDAVIWQLAECWPPGPIAVRAALWEEDMYDEDAWKIVREVSRGSIEVVSGDPRREPGEPWAVSLAGAFLDRLAKGFDCCGNDPVMPATRWQYGHGPIMHHRGWDVVWRYPEVTEGCWGQYPSAKEPAVILCFISSYDEPPVSTAPGREHRGTGGTASTTRDGKGGG